MEEYFFKKKFLRGQRVRARHPRKHFAVHTWKQINTKAIDGNTLVSIAAVIGVVLALLGVAYAKFA